MYTPIDFQTLMAIISQLECHKMPQINISANKNRYQDGTRLRSVKSTKSVPKVIGQPRRQANLTGNNRTKMRI